VHTYYKLAERMVKRKEVEDWVTCLTAVKAGKLGD
jgi:hypothetical protein